MRSDTRLDHAVFQLTANKTRCELYVVGVDEAVKLASGLLAPFKAYLPLAEEQPNSIRLEPPDPGNTPWFTKATMERFVRFVSTPEVLERVNTIEIERIQVEDTLRSQVESECLESASPSHISGGDAASESSKKSMEEGSRQWLLKALDARWLVLEKEQNTAFERANAAGFSLENIGDLVMFAECFGVTQLRDACIKFASLCDKRQKAQEFGAAGLGQLNQVDAIYTGFVVENSSSANGQGAQFTSCRRTMGNLDSKVLDASAASHCLLPPSLYISEGQEVGIVQQVIDQICKGKDLLARQPLHESLQGQGCGIQTPDKQLGAGMERDIKLSSQEITCQSSRRSSFPSRQSSSPVRGVQIGCSGSRVSDTTMHNFNYASSKRGNGLLESSGQWSEEGTSNEVTVKLKAETGHTRVQDVIGLFEKKKHEIDDAKQKISKDHTLPKRAIPRRWTDTGVSGQSQGADQEDEKQVSDKICLLGGDLDNSCQGTSNQDLTVSDHGRQLVNAFPPVKKVELNIEAEGLEGSHWHSHLNSNEMSKSLDLQDLTYGSCTQETGINDSNQLNISLEISGDMNGAGTSGQNNKSDEVIRESPAADMHNSDSHNHAKSMGTSNCIPDGKRLKEHRLKSMTEKESQINVTCKLLEGKVACMGKRSEKRNPLTEAQMRAEKLCAYKADLQKSKKNKEEKEQKRIEDLRFQRRERITARGSVAPVTHTSSSNKNVLPSSPLIINYKSSFSATKQKRPTTNTVDSLTPNVSQSIRPSTLESGQNAITHSLPSLIELKREGNKSTIICTSLTRYVSKQVSDADPAKVHLEKEKKLISKKGFGPSPTRDHAENRKKLTLSSASRNITFLSKENRLVRPQVSKVSKAQPVANKQRKTIRTPDPKVTTPSFTRQNLPKGGASNVSSPVAQNLETHVLECTDPGEKPDDGEFEHLPQTSRTADTTFDVLMESAMHKHSNAQVKVPEVDNSKVLENTSNLVKEQNEGAGHVESGHRCSEMLSDFDVKATHQPSCASFCHLSLSDAPFNLEHTDSVEAGIDGEDAASSSLDPGHYNPQISPLFQLSAVGNQSSLEAHLGAVSPSNPLLIHDAGRHDVPMAPLSQPSPTSDQYNAPRAPLTISPAATPPRSIALLHNALEDAHSPEISPKIQATIKSRKKWNQSGLQKTSKDQAKGLKRLLLLRKKCSQSSFQSPYSNRISLSMNSEGDDDMDDVRESLSSKIRSIGVSRRGMPVNQSSAIRTQYEVNGSSWTSKASRSFFSLSTFRGGKNEAKAQLTSVKGELEDVYRYGTAEV